jgi:putative membrane protein
MFINYLALMLINLAAGLMIFAGFVYDLHRVERRGWVPALAVVGFIQAAAGLHMIWNWPLPGSHNVAFGEASVLIGLVWLGLALAESRGLTLLPVMIFATFAGLAAIVIGVRIIDLGMTRSPLLSGVGYILPGLIGALSVPGYLMRTSRLVRLVGVVVLVAAGVLWAVTGYGALWGHIANYAGWVPATLRGLR